MLHSLTQSLWVERTGWVLVHSLWQFAAVALLAAVLQWALRRRSATLRYGVLLAAMSIIVVVPAASWFAIGPIEKPVHAGVPASAGLPENSRLKAELQHPDFPPPQFSDDLPISNALPSDDTKLQAAAISQESLRRQSIAWWSKVKARLEPWLPLIVLVWLAGVALFAFRPLASWHTVRRLRTVGVSPIADSIRGALSRTANQLRINRAVTILQSTLVKTPVVIGYFRPLILLPICIVSGVPESQLELILAHELAHIRRHDYLVNLLQTLIETLFFYHPAVWWLSRQIRHERENCCDDIALSLSANRADYGRALLAIEELRAAAPALSVAATGGSLLARIRRIVGKEETSAQLSRNPSLVLFVAILVLASIAGRYALLGQAKDAPGQSSSDVTSNSDTAPGDVIEGIVVDEQGKPVAGATLRGYEGSGRPDSTATSKADGTFRLPLRNPYANGTALVACDAEKARQAYSWQQDPDKPRRLVLKPSHAVDIAVVDSAARPVAGATVVALDWNAQLAQGETDAQGKLRLEIPADARNVCVLAYKSGIGLDYSEEDGDPTANLEDPRYAPPSAARLVLDGAAPMEVRTVDSAGKPLANIIVALSDLWKPGKKRLLAWCAKLTTNTDSEGRAAFNCLPANLERIHFNILDDRYVSPRMIEYRLIEGGNPRVVTARLARAATLSGRVVHPDGKPSAGVLLQAEGRPADQPETNYFRGYARTRDDGTYRIAVTPDQSYIVAVCDDRWAAKSHLGLIVKEGEERDHVDFHMERGTLIRGTVTVGPDRKPGNGEFLSRTNVTLVQLGPAFPDTRSRQDASERENRDGLPRGRDLDEHGHYEFRVAAGEYELYLPSGSTGSGRVVVRDEGEIVVDGHIAKPPPKSLQGRVVDRSGTPVANAAVRFPSLELTTGPDGRFSTYPFGPCRVYARSAEANLAGSQTVAKGDSRVTIELSPAATAAGRVLDAAGRPVAGVRVHYYFFSSPSTEHCWFSVDAETDKDGKYAMSGLPIGFQGDDVSVVWFNPVTKTYEVFHGPKFTVKAGENRLSDAILKRSALKVTGDWGKPSAANHAEKPSSDKDHPSTTEISSEDETPPGFLRLPAYQALVGRERRQRYGIDAEQEKELQNIAATYMAAQGRLNDAYKESQKLPPSEQKAKLKELSAEYRQARKDARTRMGEVLTAQQKADYARDVQYNQVIGFCEDDVRPISMILGIELSPQQREQFARLAEEEREHYRGKSKKANDRLLAVLTPEQREKLLARVADADTAFDVDVAPIDSTPPHELAHKLPPPPFHFVFYSRRFTQVTVYGQLRNPDVREELSLTADQEAKLQALLTQSETAAQEIFDRYEPKTVSPRPSQEVQTRQREECRRALEPFAKGVAAEIEAILRPRQLAGLRAIGKENRVARTLWQHDRKALDDIHVTEEQSAKLWEIYHENAEPDVASLRAQGAKALGILTAEQRKKLGDKWDVDSPASSGTSKPAETLTYTGRVMDNLTGKPIAGAMVTVIRSLKVPNSPRETRRRLAKTEHKTAANGQFSFTIPPDQVAENLLFLDIVVEHPNYIRFDRGYSLNMIRRIEKLGDQPPFQIINLELAEKVYGTTEAPDGKPAAGVEVDAIQVPNENRYWSSTSGTTDAQGFYQLMVPKQGEEELTFVSKDFAPARVAVMNRGDLGNLRLERGIVLKGRVLDVDGTPLPGISVNASLFDGLTLRSGRSSWSNQHGEFAMAPLQSGTYRLITTCSIGRGKSDDSSIHLPPAVFLDREIKLSAYDPVESVEIRAVPHVVVAGRFFDSAGKPTSGFMPTLMGTNGGSFDVETQMDKQGRFAANAPKGLNGVELFLTDRGEHALRARISQDTPLSNSRSLKLGTLDRNVTDIAVVLYKAPTLLVKAVAEDGKVMNGSRAEIKYPRGREPQGEFIRDGKRAGHVRFERQDDGRWRSEQLLPDEAFTLTVSAEGYRPQSEILTLPEGAVKELEVKLEPTAKADDANDKTSTAKPADSASPAEVKLRKEWADRGLSVPRDFMLLPAYRKLEMPDVRKHFGITPAQEKRLWEIAAEYDAASRKLYDAYDDLLRLPPQERKTGVQQWQEKRDQARHAFDKPVADVLTAEQRAAYQHDVRGDTAFGIGSLASQDAQWMRSVYGVELSAEQQQQMKRLVDETEENREKTRKSMEQQTLAVLTTQQREKLLARFSDAEPFMPSALVPGSTQQRPSLAKKPSLDFRFASGSNATIIVSPELTDSDVRKALALTADQESKLLAIQAKSQAAAIKLFERYELKAPADESPEARNARHADYLRKKDDYQRTLKQFALEVIGQIVAVLQPRQVSALKAMAEKDKAIGALEGLNRAALDDIQATTEQRAKLRQIWNEYEAHEYPVPNMPLPSAAGEKAWAILTPEQRKKVDEVIQRWGW